MNIAIVLYDRFTALDAIGPYEVLSRLPGASLSVPGRRAGAGAHRQRHAHAARRALAGGGRRDPDIVLVPGGPGEVAARAGGADARLAARRARDEHVDDVRVHRLAGARRRRAARRAGAPPATGWRSRSSARSAPSRSHERVVFDGKLVTAAGVSAGIDMALALAARVAGEQVAQAIQLGIEYDPQPPFDAGSPQKAPRGDRRALRARSRFPEARAPAAQPALAASVPCRSRPLTCAADGRAPLRPARDRAPLAGAVGARAHLGGRQRG